MARIYTLARKAVKNMSLTVYDVANVFLSMDSMANKKLQKLCYYAQAWHLALYKERLFDNYFEAWVHGPVCPDLYHSYKHYGWTDIPKAQGLPTTAREKYDFIGVIYTTYGGFTGDQLEALTHSEWPWQQAREGYEEWEPCNNKVNEDIMRDFYWKRYEQSQND